MEINQYLLELHLSAVDFPKESMASDSDDQHKLKYTMQFSFGSPALIENTGKMVQHTRTIMLNHLLHYILMNMTSNGLKI